MEEVKKKIEDSDGGEGVRRDEDEGGGLVVLSE